MTVVTARETPRKSASSLAEARARTRGLAYGELVGAIFPIPVGPGPADKAWYQVISLRPLRVEWVPYSKYRVAPEALADLSKGSIYRLIEADVLAS